MLIKEVFTNAAESIFIKNLKNLMDMHGINTSELSKKTGIPYQSLVSIINGNTHNPGIDSLDKLVRFFKVSSDSLLGIDDQLKKNPEVIRIIDPASPKIPLLKWEDVHYWCAQGFNFLNVQHQEWIACNTKISSAGFALRVRYEGCNVFPVNSIILIDPQKKYIIGDYVLASIRRNKPTIKQIAEGDGIQYLIPLKVTSPIEKVELNNQILGVVVEYRINIKND